MLPWLTSKFGNPSGSHHVARAARAAVDDARDLVADLIGVAPGEVAFTSGGTESDNLAVLGTVSARPGPIVVSAVEHAAVMEPALASGEEVRVAPVGLDGIVDLDGLRRLLDPGVTLVSIQAANHETGVVQDLRRIAGLVRKLAPRAIFHTDAVQAAAWLDMHSISPSADLISISGHKMGGPQGVGALAVRGKAVIRAVLHGGGQERELRSGTHNVAGIAGLGAAAGALKAEREAHGLRVAELRDELARSIAAGVPRSRVTAEGAPRLPGHLHLRFDGVESEPLLVLLDDAGVCASAGAACASGAMEPSPILLAMGVTKEDALSSLRLTLGPTTTADEVDLAARCIPAAVARLRSA